ncbi:hypothetical protein BDW62DRAFT_193242 [Aspergillus aurantiobrunneus]
MSRVVTEIVNITFTPGANVEETIALLTSTLTQQEGFIRLKWGRWEEDADEVQMMINWADISFHRKFEQSAEYPAFLARLDGILAAPPALIHVHFDEEMLNKILAGPVVELATFYGIAEGFEEAVEKTLAVGSESKGCLGYVRGDVVEEIAASESQPKGRAHYAAIAWTSAQAHWDATKRPEVQESGLLTVEKVGGYEAHHVKFQ